ncbi:MAG: DegT/DnrJ/EryC1/StrS family aminotransferase [Bacteroidota bacterium]
MSSELRTIPWWQPELGGKELPLVNEVLESNYLNDGEVTRKLEKLFAARVQAEFAVGTTSGTAALALALQAVGVGYGDEVLVPDITFIATANAVTLAGAKVVLVDIDPKSLGMCPKDMIQKITDSTKAVVPVHISGRGTTIYDIAKIARAHNLFVIEDAAEALGSYYKGDFLGTIGDLGCYSLSPNKTITSGQGGVIVTNSDSWLKRLRELKDQGRAVQGTGADDEHVSVGYNFKLTNIQSAIGLGQFELLEMRLERLRRNYIIYCEELSAIDGVQLFPVDVEGQETPQWTDGLFDRKDKLYEYLHNKNIHCRKFWFPIHQSKPYFSRDELFPNSTAIWESAMWLPSSFKMTDDDIRYVSHLILKFYNT